MRYQSISTSTCIYHLCTLIYIIVAVAAHIIANFVYKQMNERTTHVSCAIRIYKWYVECGVSGTTMYILVGLFIF